MEWWRDQADGRERADTEKWHDGCNGQTIAGSPRRHVGGSVRAKWRGKRRDLTDIAA